MDAVDLVIVVNEWQLASRFREAGEIDTQSQAGTMFPLGRLEEEGPLGVCSKVQHAAVCQSYLLKKRLSALVLTDSGWWRTVLMSGSRSRQNAAPRLRCW